jgi:hypothetical protein
VLILQWDETFDVGAEYRHSGVRQDYQVPFKFTGKLNKLTLSIERPKLTPEDNGGGTAQPKTRRSRGTQGPRFRKGMV